MSRQHQLQDATGVLLSSEDGKIIMAIGTAVPADGSSGYLPGAIFFNRSGTSGVSQFVNEGSVTSSLFKAVLGSDFGTGTSAAGAITLNKRAGLVTTEALTTAAAGDYTHVLTNSFITAASMVIVCVFNGTNTIHPVTVNTITPTAGSVSILFRNSNAGALNGTLKYTFYVIK